MQFGTFCQDPPRHTPTVGSESGNIYYCFINISNHNMSKLEHGLMYTSLLVYRSDERFKPQVTLSSCLLVMAVL